MRQNVVKFGNDAKKVKEEIKELEGNLALDLLNEQDAECILNYCEEFLDEK